MWFCTHWKSTAHCSLYLNHYSFFPYEWACFRILKLLESLHWLFCEGLVSHNNMSGSFIHTESCVPVSFSLLVLQWPTVACIWVSFSTTSAVSYAPATFCLSVHLPINTLTMSIFWLFKLMLLWSWCTNNIYGLSPCLPFEHIPKGKMTESQDNSLYFFKVT